MIEKLDNKQRGFGLLEVMIASATLIMVIGGVLFLERSAIKSNILSSEKSQAFNLARSGVELVRANRDTKWIDEIVNNWNESFSLAGSSAAYYVLECATENCALQQISDPTINITNAEQIDLNGVEFYRYIMVEQISSLNPNFNAELEALTDVSESGGQPIYNMGNSDNQILTKLSSVVVWETGEGTQDFAIPFVLTDWKPF